MAGGTIEIRLATDAERDFRRLATQFKQAARGGLQQDLRKNIHATAIPILNELRQAVLAVDVTSPKGGKAPPSYSRSLRRRIAAATRISVAYQGVRFGVTGSAVGAYGGSLAKYMDSTLGGYSNWRHPVFGGPAWSTQQGKPWFFVTIERHADDFEAACWRAIREVLNELGG